MYSMDNDIDHILVSEDALKAKVNELGAQISRDYAGKDLLLVSILKGSVVFMAVPTRPPRALSRSSRTWTPT